MEMPKSRLLISFIVLSSLLTLNAQGRHHTLYALSSRDTMPTDRKWHAMVEKLIYNISRNTNSRPQSIKPQGVNSHGRYGDKVTLPVVDMLTRRPSASQGGPPLKELSRTNHTFNPWEPKDANHQEKPQPSYSGNGSVHDGRQNVPPGSSGSDDPQGDTNHHRNFSSTGESKDEHEGHNHEEAPRGPKNEWNPNENPTEHSVFVYNGTTGKLDKRNLSGEDFVPTQPHRKDLCSLCLCTQDFSTVACLHSHSQETGSHFLNLTKELIPREAQALLISGYEYVSVQAKTFAAQESNLRSIKLQNIQKLVLESESFLFSAIARENRKVSLTFYNCDIPRLPSETLTQKVQGRHEQGKKFLFQREKTRYMTIHISQCKIGVMEQKSMWQARLMTLNMSKTTINKIEAKAIDLDVAELCKFHGNHLPSLPPHAICLHAKSTVFLDNFIQEMSNRSVAVETEGLVLFKHNEIGFLRSDALLGITPLTGQYGSGVNIINNILKEVEPDSLSIDSSFSLQEFSIQNNTIHIPCECDVSDTIGVLLGNSTHMKDAHYYIVQGSRCKDELSGTTPTVSAYLVEECKPFPVITVSAVGVAILLLVVTVTVCVVCSLRVQHVKEEANMLGDCASQSFSTLNRPYNENTLRTPCHDEQLSPSPFALWGLAVPEIKTYQQNQTPAFTEQTESIHGSRGTLQSQRLNPENRASCPLN